MSQEITNKDLDEYVTILKSTNQLPADFDLETATPSERADLLGKYNAWMQQGKPKPKMPKQEAEKKQVLRCYRIKIFGKEYLYYRTLNEVIPVGVKEHPIYRKTQDENGDTVTDKTTVLKWDREYLNPYSEAKAKKLVERCVNESPKPQFHLVYSGRTIACSPESFVGEFDEGIQKFLNGKPI